MSSRATTAEMMAGNTDDAVPSWRGLARHGWMVVKTRTTIYATCPDCGEPRIADRSGEVRWWMVFHLGLAAGSATLMLVSAVTRNMGGVLANASAVALNGGLAVLARRRAQKIPREQQCDDCRALADEAVRVQRERETRAAAEQVSERYARRRQAREIGHLKQLELLSGIANYGELNHAPHRQTGVMRNSFSNAPVVVSNVGDGDARFERALFEKAVAVVKRTSGACHCLPCQKVERARQDARVISELYAELQSDQTEPCRACGARSPCGDCERIDAFDQPPCIVRVRPVPPPPRRRPA